MEDLKIATPLTLKCGLILRNRLVKAAMAEQNADRKGLPTKPDFIAAYQAWSEGNWGLVLSGNVDVDPEYLGSPGDVVAHTTPSSDPSSPPTFDTQALATWKQWATAASANSTPVLVQLNHPGRQVQGKRGVAPSAISLDFGSGLVARAARALVFPTPREMTVADIHMTTRRFAAAASLAAEAGFAGVEMHAAHGYLLAQFLSEKSNHRGDEYGGSAANRARFVVEVLEAVRAAVPKDFCVAIKLNSVDVQGGGGAGLADCVEQLKLIAGTGVDFIEISGGTYEDPSMGAADVEELHKSRTPSIRASTLAREAFFLDFAARIRSDLPEVPLLVTGGFRTRRGAEAAVSEDHCDLVGFARPAALQPRLPRDVILTGAKGTDDVAAAITPKTGKPLLERLTGVRAVGVGVESAWYAERIREAGKKHLAAKA